MLNFMLRYRVYRIFATPPSGCNSRQPNCLPFAAACCRRGGGLVWTFSSPSSGTDAATFTGSADAATCRPLAGHAGPGNFHVMRAGDSPSAATVSRETSPAIVTPLA